MPTFTKLKSGSWRVQVRRKREYVANTFIRRRDAEAQPQGEHNRQAVRDTATAKISHRIQEGAMWLRGTLAAH